jgi:hypothetical protein
MTVQGMKPAVQKPAPVVKKQAAAAGYAWLQWAATQQLCLSIK